MVFVVLQIRTGTRVLKGWYGCICPDSVTLADAYNLYSSGQLDNSIALTLENSAPVITCHAGKQRHDLIRVSSSAEVGEVVSSLGQFVEFNIDFTQVPATSSSPVVDAFTVLLKGAHEKTSLPPKWNASNAKLKLKNGIIDWLSSNKLGWEPSMSKQLGLMFVNSLGEALWYIDGNSKTLGDRSLSVSPLFQHLQGYRKPEKHKHKKVDADSLEASELCRHSTTLATLAATSYMKSQRWVSVREAVLNLSESFRKYATYLDKQREAMKVHHSRLEVNTDVDELSILAGKPLFPGPTARYSTLHEALQKAREYDPIFVNDHAPPDPRRRYDYKKHLVVPCKCVKYVFTGSTNHLSFLWRVPIDATESEVLNQSLKVTEELKKSFPVYHSRAMRREFIYSFGKVTNSKPAFLREAYRRLTGDQSSSSNATEQAIDDRVRQMLDDEDPDLICDLRINNDGRPEKYEVFLDCCRKYIDVEIDTAVDDRRHDSFSGSDVVTHLATAMSVTDLHAQVTKSCPEGTPIPSVQWLRVQFWPRRANSSFAKQQKGRLNIKFMIQARQFRKSHVDAHYASALFRYLKEFSILYAPHSTFVSMDDKHTIKVGEPGYPVAAVERGRQVLVTSAKKLAVGDHDFTKFSLTPSVTFLIDIPKSIADGSFYSGKVFVGLKENAFEPSSPIRHVTELNVILDSFDDKQPILLMYTDGGPDHRLTYSSVQICLINLFLARDLDFLCAVRTPPYHSWKNPAERIMSILNIGLQCVGVMRKETESFEESLKQCNNLSAIRSLREKQPSLADEVKDALEPMKALLQGIFTRLSLKGNSFSTFTAASTTDIDEMMKHILHVDCTVTKECTQKAQLEKKEAYQDFLTHHCRVRHYMFSIKKCSRESCVCKPPRLPVDIFRSLSHLPDPVPDDDCDHYKAFNDLYGKGETSEEYRPSLKQSEAKNSGMPFSPSTQSANNTNTVIQCQECDKWRLVYSKNVLSPGEKSELQTILETVQYSCGSIMQDIDHEENSVLEKVFTRANLSCTSNIEIPYYGTRHEPLCIYCGSEDDLETSNAECTCYPMCKNCSELNKLPILKRKRVSTASSSASKKTKV